MVETKYLVKNFVIFEEKNFEDSNYYWNSSPDLGHSADENVNYPFTMLFTARFQERGLATQGHYHPRSYIAWVTPSLYCAYCLYSKQFYLKDFYFLPFGYFFPVLVFWAVGHDKNLFELFLAILGYSLFDLAWNMDCSKRHSSNWEMSLNFLDRLAGSLMSLFRTLSESAQKGFTNGF